jgi:broad specificity phosphatase PhoE
VNPDLKTIVLVRHARSTANDDPRLYKTTPDHAIPLARPSDDPAARVAGRALAGLGLDPAQLCSWCSTYLRCKQTEMLVLDEAYGAAAAAGIHRRASFLLREQEFGDWDSLTEEEIAAKDPSGSPGASSSTTTWASSTSATRSARAAPT